MEMIFATILGCILSFLCGAAVVYGRELLHCSYDQPEETEEDLEMNEQWVKLLNYDGSQGED